jgi:glycosyltransferase involved in cell wall biosynthesis
MNTPDESVFGPPREPAAPPRTGRATAIYHGGTARRFGVSVLVEAFGLLGDDPDVRLRVLGSDDGIPEMAALAAKVAPGTVDVDPRPTPFREIPRRLEAADIGVVPTVRDDFTELLLPVKLLEYVHMGLPVVATRLPVVERYFGDGELRFCEPGDPAAMAEAIAEVRARPDEAVERARRASARMRDIAWGRQRQVYLELMEGLARKRAAA